MASFALFVAACSCEPDTPATPAQTAYPSTTVLAPEPTKVLNEVVQVEGNAAPGNAAPGNATESGIDVLPSPSNLGPSNLGPAIRLSTLRVSFYRASGIRQPIPRVALLDELSRSRLDELILEDMRTRTGRCRISLALQTMVAMRCETSFEQDAVDAIAHVDSYYRVGSAGDVSRVALQTFLAPGIELSELPGILMSDPDFRSEGTLVFTPFGLELDFLDAEGHRQTRRFGWRALAPYLHSSSALAPTLLEQGLALGVPAGTSAKPPRALALAHLEPAALIEIWSNLPEEARTQVRFVAHDRASARLIFSPELPTQDVRRWIGNHPLVPAYFAAARSEIGLAKTKASTEVRNDFGARALIEARLPRGTLVNTLLGDVWGHDSTLSTGWAYARYAQERFGWLSSRYLEVQPVEHQAQCASLMRVTTMSVSSDGADDAMHVVLRGVSQVRQGPNVRRLAWFVGTRRGQAGQIVMVHALNENCEVGERLARIFTEYPVVDLAFAPSSIGDGLLIALLTSDDEHADARPELLVFASDRDRALYRHEGASDIVVGDVRAPFAFRGGERTMRLEWNDEQLLAVER